MKRYLLILLILFTINVSAFDFYVKGDVDISASINGVSLNADYGTQYIKRARGTLSVEREGSDAGSFVMEFSFSRNFTADELTIRAGSSNVGTAKMRADAVEEKLIIESLSWNGGKSLLGQWSLEDGLERTFFANLIKDGKTVGSVSFSPKVFGVNEGSNVFTIGSSSQLNVVLTTESLIDQANIVTNSFSGLVTSASGLPVTSGQVIASAGGFVSVSKIEEVNGRGGYGFYGVPLVVSGIPGTEIEFFISDDKVASATLTSDPVRRLDLVWSQSTSDSNFPDFDFDGVPNNLDICPNTFKAVVNAEGCSCKQIMLIHNNIGRCVVTADKGPVYIPPPPPPKPAAKCPAQFKNACLPERPKFCDNNLQIVNDCERCGCSPGFECNPVVDGEVMTDGNCYNVIRRQNITCLKNNYQMAPGLNCADLGENWLDVFEQPGVGDLSTYVNVKVERNFWAGSSQRRKIAKKAVNNLRSQTLCIETENIGCVMEDAKCPGQEEFYLSFDDTLASLEKRLDGQFKRKTHSADVLSLLASRPINWNSGVIGIFSTITNAIGAACCGKIDVEYNMNPTTVPDFPLRYNSTCNDFLANSTSSCNAFGPTGHKADNFDIFFVGDAFDSEDELKETVALLLDRESNKTGTAEEGLFSRELFKRRKDDFNIWIKDGGEFSRNERSNRPSYGFSPVRAEVEKLNPGCSQRDLTIVLSKGGPYKSYCPTRKLCFFSLTSEQFPGRALLKTLGLAFGLADESYFNITEFLVAGEISDLNHAGIWASANCKRDKSKAEEAWGALASPDNAIGYFTSCGGDCDDSCAEFIRPTFNSVMRNNSARCSETQCVQGPPFDPYYTVNEKQLLEQMLEFEEPLERT